MTYGPIVYDGYEIHADDDEDLLVMVDDEMWPEHGEESDTVAIRPMFEVFWDHMPDCFVCAYAKTHGELIEV